MLRREIDRTLGIAHLLPTVSLSNEKNWILVRHSAAGMSAITTVKSKLSSSQTTALCWLPVDTIQYYVFGPSVKHSTKKSFHSKWKRDTILLFYVWLLLQTIAASLVEDRTWKFWYTTFKRELYTAIDDIHIIYLYILYFLAFLGNKCYVRSVQKIKCCTIIPLWHFPSSLTTIGTYSPQQIIATIFFVSLTLVKIHLVYILLYF